MYIGVIFLTIKEYFEEVFDIQKIINQRKARIEDLRDTLGFFGVSFTKDGVKTKTKTDKTADTVITIQDEIEECQNEISRLISLQKRLKTLIDSVKGHQGRYILYERYILLKEWEQIRKENHYSENHVFKIRRQALEQIMAKLDSK